MNLMRIWEKTGAIDGAYGEIAGLTDEEINDLFEQNRLAVCRTTGRWFDIGGVQVLARYADCSVFRCPCCGMGHDDRRWADSPGERMGYAMLIKEAGWQSSMSSA